MTSHSHNKVQTHMAFLGETSRFTPNRLTIVPTTFLFVLS